MLRGLPWIHFETEPGAGGEEPPAPEPPAEEQGGGEGGGETSPESQPWEEPLAELRDQVGELVGYFQGASQQDFAPQDQGVEQPELQPPDPWSENYQQELATYLEARDQRILGMLQPVVEHSYMGQAEQQLNQALASVPAEHQNLLGEDNAERMREAIAVTSAGFMPPGADPQQLPEVVAHTAQYLNDLIGLAKQQAVEEFKASLQGGGEQGRQIEEPPISGAGLPGPGEPSSYQEIIERGLAGMSN